jgi:hypothetical protein
MPFGKKITPPFYTGVNFLKKHWKDQVTRIDSTPAQVQYALDQLMFLCAELDVDRNRHRVRDLVNSMSKVGYKLSTEVENGEEAVNDMALDMLKLLSDKESDGV